MNMLRLNFTYLLATYENRVVFSGRTLSFRWTNFLFHCYRKERHVHAQSMYLCLSRYFVQLILLKPLKLIDKSTVTQKEIDVGFHR